jgi:hypothetical protein
LSYSSLSDLDAPSKSSVVRLLPYSFVPGMTFSSPLFLKAVEILSKQQHKAASSKSIASTEAPIASSSLTKEKSASGEFSNGSLSHFSY